jgi:transcriptional regulator with XRE-family HTH domain
MRKQEHDAHATDTEHVAAQLIAQIRGRSGLSQAELARAAGMTRSVVNAYERGRRQPGVDALARLAGAARLHLRLGAEQTSSIDPARAARILEQVLDLAEALPHRRPGPLRYPLTLAQRS